jgi:hypothetical protein
MWPPATAYLPGQSYPAPKPLEKVLDVPDVSKADVQLNFYSSQENAI